MRGVIASALALLAAFSSAQSLGPGVQAPPIKVAEFVKGQTVTDLSKGVFVVEFWATWCGPCIVSIPHISSLAKKHEGKVTVVGVSVWERGDDIAGMVKKFVDGQGDKMSYNVARDEGMTMAETWMQAAGQNGIPAAFVIKDGIVQWIGHPMNMDEPLAQVIAGTFDLEASKAAFKAEMEAEAKMAAFMQAVQTGAKTYRDGDMEAGRTQILGADSGGDAGLDLQRNMTLLGLYVNSEPLRFRRLANEMHAAGDSARLNLAYFCYNTARQANSNKALLGKIAERIGGEASEKNAIALYYAGMAMMSCENAEGALRAFERAQGLVGSDEYPAAFVTDLNKAADDARSKVKPAQ